MLLGSTRLPVNLDSWNAPSSILTTPTSITRVPVEGHFKNALFPIVLTVPGIRRISCLIECKLANALVPIVVTSSGIGRIDTNPHPEKHSSEITDALVPKLSCPVNPH